MDIAAWKLGSDALPSWAESLCVTGKSAMRYDKAVCRLCLLGNRAKLERVRIYAAGELL